jgi:hypothetical protein
MLVMLIDIYNFVTDSGSIKTEMSEHMYAYSSV